MTEPFADLPDALVRDLLDISETVAEEVRHRIEHLARERGTLRMAAEDNGLVRRQADLERVREPSVAAVDGSYQLHRLTSLDLCGSAAVAVEGTSKEAARHWPEPRHRMWARAVQHADETTVVVRALMVCMELDLLCEAPHDVVLLDGAFASVIIYLNQGLSKVEDVPDELGSALHARWDIRQLLDVLGSPRLAAAPKYTSRNELATDPRQGLGALAAGVDGRTLATVILEPGEYTVPLDVYAADAQTYHVPTTDIQAADRLAQAMRDVQVVYYRPFGWAPALRLELPGAALAGETRLAMALEGVRSQFFSPAVIEPYPLFLADRMVKSLGAGVAVIEQQVAQHAVEHGVDAELTLMCLQNYRTEGGR